MRVALVGAEFEENLAVRYLWAALQARGHEVLPIVFNEESDLESAAGQLAHSAAPLAGLSMVFTYRARQFAELATRARALGFRGHIVAGGHFASFHARELLCDVPALDSVIRGEGEQPICELAGRLQDLPSVAGLVFRSLEGVTSNPDAIKPEDLDTLAWPTHKRPFDNYLGLPIANLLSSRGCSHSCAFCSIAAWHRVCGGPRFRMRSPVKVADEMADLFRRGVRIFNFHDDNFLLGTQSANLERLAQLQDELDKRRVGRIAFAIKSRPDAVDPELFARLKSMGLFRVFLGIEAGTPDSLRRLGRRQTVEQNVAALEVMRKLDLHACFNLLLLNPDSTLEDLAGNVAFLREHAANPMNFCRTEIYAGTPLERRLRRQNRLLGDYWGLDYTIADPRAQAAFDLIYPCFENRNYGIEGLHHLNMQVDYEHQLLSHFFESHPDLRRRVKRFIVEVNTNTCDHLDRAIQLALAGIGDMSAATRELSAAVEADNRWLSAKAKGLVEEIRSLAVAPARPRRQWACAAAAAGVVASLALSAQGCKEHVQPLPEYPMPAAGPPDAEPPLAGADAGLQAVPGPTPPETYEAEMAAAPVIPPGPPDWIRPEFLSSALPRIARVVPDVDLHVELSLSSTGSVLKVVVSGRGLSPQSIADAEQEVGGMTFGSQQAYAHRFSLDFTAGEVHAARPVATHRSEMIAPRPPPTHMHEKAPPRRKP